MGLIGHHVELRVVLEPLRRQLPDLELLGLRIELRDAALIHHAEQEIAVAIDAEVEIAGGEALAQLGHGVFGVLARLRIDLAQELLAEIRVPGLAVDDDHVMRLDGRARQVIFRDDHIGAATFYPRQGLELELVLRARAQIDRGEILGHFAEALGIGGTRLIHPPLRLDWLAHLGIAVHARDHLHELVGVVARFHHPLERVAAHAVDQLKFVVVAAGDAHHPFGIRELLAQIPGLAQLEIGGCGLGGLDLGGFGAFEVVADRKL